jgi:hypothetical protein
MTRVSRQSPRFTACLIAGIAIAGCGSDSGESSNSAEMQRKLISFNPMYSAYDGTHDYQVTPSVPSADPAAKDSDPVDPATLKWEVDSAFVRQDPFDQIPAAIMLTTKKAGTTIVKVTGKTKSGLAVKDQATLNISQSSEAEWEAGDMRYNNGMSIDFTMITVTRSTDGMTMCGLPVNVGSNLPKTSACSNCHNGMSTISVQHTPTQTAGYSNEQLIQIFTQGEKPAGGTFNSPFLKALPQADCIYKGFHTWDIDDMTKSGIVWKLRSIPPQKQADIDIARLAMMARAAMANGAAGAPSP